MKSGRVGSVVTLGSVVGAGTAGVLVSVLASAQPQKGGWLPPLPAGSASAASSAAPKPPAAPAPASPPGYMYEEEWTPPSGGAPARAAAPQGPAGAPAYRPAAPPGYYPYPPPPPPGYPEYVYEPPPPPPPRHRAPVGSLWLGVRAGVLFPAGYLYDDGSDPYYPTGPGWGDVAGSGPLVELNLGGRLARRFLLFAAWEHASLGTGGDSYYQTAFGSQTSARTDFAGMGFRWSSSPDDVGLALELGLGYRWFRERWASGYRLNLEGFGEFRFGLGADIRVSRMVAISPMLMIAEGVFNDREFGLPGQAMQSIRSYAAAHQTVSLTLGGHFDIFGSY
jgi:hypothetical protein